MTTIEMTVAEVIAVMTEEVHAMTAEVTAGMIAVAHVTTEEVHVMTTEAEDHSVRDQLTRM